MKEKQDAFYRTKLDRVSSRNRHSPPGKALRDEETTRYNH